MPDLSGIVIFMIAAVGGFIGALMIVPMAIAEIWIDGLMAWAFVPPVAGLFIGAAVGAMMRR